MRNGSKSGGKPAFPTFELLLLCDAFFLEGLLIDRGRKLSDNIFLTYNESSLSASACVRKLRPCMNPKQFGDPQLHLNGAAISNSVVR
jgi:hypothetical protein